MLNCSHCRALRVCSCSSWLAPAAATLHRCLRSCWWHQSACSVRPRPLHAEAACRARPARHKQQPHTQSQHSVAAPLTWMLREGVVCAAAQLMCSVQRQAVHKSRVLHDCLHDCPPTSAMTASAAHSPSVSGQASSGGPRPAAAAASPRPPCSAAAAAALPDRLCVSQASHRFLQGWCGRWGCTALSIYSGCHCWPAVRAVMRPAGDCNTWSGQG